MFSTVHMSASRRNFQRAVHLFKPFCRTLTDGGVRDIAPPLVREAHTECSAMRTLIFISREIGYLPSMYGSAHLSHTTIRKVHFA